mgnify:CR=1 FL=1
MFVKTGPGDEVGSVVYNAVPYNTFLSPWTSTLVL